MPEPDQQDWPGLLRRRRWWVLLGALAGASASIWLGSAGPPMYRSSTEVLVKPVVPDSDGVLTAESVDMSTEERIAGSLAVTGSVVETEELDVDVGTFLRRLSVTVVSGSLVLEIAYTDPDPGVARRVASAAAAAYLQHRRNQAGEAARDYRTGVLERIGEVEAELEGLFRRRVLTDRDQARVSALTHELASLRASIPPDVPVDPGLVLRRADRPRSAVTPHPVTSGMVGAVAGVFVGLTLGVIRERTDNRLHGRLALEASIGAPVLAVIPRFRRWRYRQRPALPALSSPGGPAAEAFRVLRTGLVFAARRDAARTILVTGAGVGEGKTMTAANLAVALAQAEHRVILIDADLRRPRLHQLFGMPKGAGLSTVVTTDFPLFEALRPTRVANLRVLPSGPAPERPAELLASEVMAELLNVLAHEADLVVVDSPPLLFADALSLAPFTDGVLFVAEDRSTTERAVLHARVQLEHVDARLIGAVLNRFRGRHAEYYGYGRYRRRRREVRFRRRGPTEGSRTATFRAS